MSSHRIDDGNLTVNLQDSEWQMVVIKQAKDKTALKDMFELLEKIHAGEFPSGKEEISISNTCPSTHTAVKPLEYYRNTLYMHDIICGYSITVQVTYIVRKTIDNISNY